MDVSKHHRQTMAIRKNIETLAASKIKVIVEVIPFLKVIQVKLSKFQERRPSITMYQSVDNQVLRLKIKESQCNVTIKEIKRVKKALA